jgi:hypothetical protein
MSDFGDLRGGRVPVKLRAGALLLGLLLACSLLPAFGATGGSKPQRWSDPSTWGGQVPGAGANVTIPAGQTVLLDVSPPALGGLQVDGSLVFAEKNLNLTAEWIMVHGSFQIGSHSKPFRHRATITLTGREGDVMGMGARVFGVMGGRLELHGAPRTGWLKLAETAAPGTSTLQLTKSPGWRAGDSIVVASTDYWSDHSEEATVKHASGKTITLSAPLELQHWGIKQNYAGGVVDERAEVALLSRNIVIQGAEDSLGDGFGGHMMIMEGGRARIEGVELRHMGQQGILRRYPLHWHMLGNAADSYFKNSVIHHAFNRCLVVHGTNNLKIKGNVCYDHIGHGYFLEDGAETGNRFIRNLGLGTREPEDNPLLPSDTRPATFWITNPDNIFKGNVAAGSDDFGFWIALPEHPTGLSANDSVWPRRTPLGTFSGNVAHSNGNDGLFVDHGPKPDGTTETTYYRPVVNPADNESEPVVAQFKNFTAYKNRDRAIWLRGENHDVVGAILADNRSGGSFASSETFLSDSLVVGETANKGNVEDWEDTGLDGRGLPFFWEPSTPIIGFEFYDGRVGVRNVTFAQFQPNSQRQSGALGYLEPDAFSIDPKNFATGVHFVDSNEVRLADPVPGEDGDLSKVFIDQDGSVTGQPGAAVVVNNPFLLDESCSFKANWNVHVCGTEYASLIAATLDDDPADIKPLVLDRGNGTTQTLMGCCDDSTSAITSILPNRSYGVAFNGGTPSGVRFVLYRGQGRWIHLSIQRGPGFVVTRWGQPLDGTASLEAMHASAESTYFYDEAASTLHLKITAPDSQYEEVRVTNP